jgi:hypothetical protein
MVNELQKDLSVFRQLESPDVSAGNRGWDVARRTMGLAQKMVDEVAEWRIVYRMHEVSKV